MPDYWTEYSFLVKGKEENIDKLLEILTREDERNPGDFRRENPTEMWFKSEDDGDTCIQDLADVFSDWVQATGEGPVHFEWSFSCSKPALDAFGGGAVVILRSGEQRWNNGSDFIEAVLREEGEPDTRVEDGQIKQIWQCCNEDCGKNDVPIYAGPESYQEVGFPVCPDCDQGAQYICTVLRGKWKKET